MPTISKDLSVRLITIVATPVVAGLVAYAAKHGVNLPSNDVLVLTVAAALAVLGAGFHWLQRQPVILKTEDELEKLAESIATKVKADPVTAGAVQDLGDQLKAHTDEIIKTIGTAVHAPPSAQEVLEQMAAAILGKPLLPAPAPAVAKPPARARAKADSHD